MLVASHATQPARCSGRNAGDIAATDERVNTRQQYRTGAGITSIRSGDMTSGTLLHDLRHWDGAP
jgi:hypothetical protein